MKERIKKLEELRINVANLTYREVVEGTEDDKLGGVLENKVLHLITDARLIGELDNDKR